jgi:hypothetical protein
MPWARVPPDKLVNLPLFGIDVVMADDGDFFWVRGPKGRMRVRKSMPRVWFETVEDAHQCGATAIRITTDADQADLDALNQSIKAEREAAEAAEDNEPTES